MVAKRQRKKGNPVKSVAFTAGKKQKRQRKTEKTSKSDAFLAGKKRKRQRKSRKSPKFVAPLSDCYGSYLYTGKREKHKICKKMLAKNKVVIYYNIYGNCYQNKGHILRREKGI